MTFPELSKLSVEIKLCGCGREPIWQTWDYGWGTFALICEVCKADPIWCKTREGAANAWNGSR